MNLNQRNNVMDNFVSNIEQEMVFYPKRNVNKSFKPETPQFSDSDSVRMSIGRPSMEAHDMNLN